MTGNTWVQVSGFGDYSLEVFGGIVPQVGTTIFLFGWNMVVRECFIDYSDSDTVQVKLEVETL